MGEMCVRAGGGDVLACLPLLKERTPPSSLYVVDNLLSFCLLLFLAGAWASADFMALQWRTVP